MAHILGLPVEVHQSIACHLEGDVDVANYAMTCTAISKCINDSLWAMRFSNTFDSLPPEAIVTSPAIEYKRRKCLAAHFTNFNSRGVEGPLINCAKLLLWLIRESNAHMSTNERGNTVIVGRNLEFLRRFTSMVGPGGARDILGGTNILEALCTTMTPYHGMDFMTTSHTPKAFAHMIQLTLLHLIFHPTHCLSRPAVADMSQEVSYRSQVFEPIFKGWRRDELNIYWLLHVVNHFKFHLKQRGEGILEHVFRALDEDNLPRGWTGILKNETTNLGKRWKGAALFLDRHETAIIRAIPDITSSGTVWIDQVGDGNDGFQDLFLFFDIEAEPRLHFPQNMERFVSGKPRKPLKDLRTGKLYTPEVKDFFGLGFNGTDYHLRGRLHALPPQHNILGFQKVVMVMYMREAADAHGHQQYVREWAYEGLVTPGNTFMIGRWWDVFGPNLHDRQPYCGPFLFWNVTATMADEESMNISTALRYLDAVGDNAEQFV